MGILFSKAKRIFEMPFNSNEIFSQGQLIGNKRKSDCAFETDSVQSVDLETVLYLDIAGLIRSNDSSLIMFVRDEVKQLRLFLGNLCIEDSSAARKQKTGLIQGSPGSGKSVAVWQWCLNMRHSKRILWVHFGVLNSFVLIDKDEFTIYEFSINDYNYLSRFKSSVDIVVLDAVIQSDTTHKPWIGDALHMPVILSNSN